MRLPSFNQIKWKITLVILVTNIVLLLLGYIALVIYDSVTSRHNLIHQVETIAEVAGANSASALGFNIARDAEETIYPLIARTDVDFACLYTLDGKPFVYYSTNGVTLDVAAPLAGMAEGHYFDKGRLVLKRTVMFRDDPVGSIVICANLSQQTARSKAFLAIALSVLVGLVGVGLLLATRLQRLVSDPIADLAKTANYITEHKDYRTRAEGTSNDEVGTLVGAFNQMLSVIDRQNRDLLDGENRLKMALSASQMGMWEWNFHNDAVTWSDEANRFFGPPAKGTDIAAFGQRIHVEDADRVIAALRHSAEHLSPFTAEYRVQTGHGEILWMAHQGQTLLGYSGRPVVLAGIVQDITARKNSEAERQKLVGRLLHAEEDERRRIARELHDTTAQHLAVLKINFALLADQNDDNPDPRLALECRQLLDQALLELRTLTYVLHPPLLEEFGLVGALRDFTMGVSRRNGIKVELETSDFDGRLSPSIELALFRVVQESVTNAIRHSGTKEILIRLARDSSEARIEVQDFGQGFPSRANPIRNAGVGIASMQERLALVGGALDVESDGEGVTVLASVPLDAGPDLPSI